MELSGRVTIKFVTSHNIAKMRVASTGGICLISMLVLVIAGTFKLNLFWKGLLNDGPFLCDLHM